MANPNVGRADQIPLIISKQRVNSAMIKSFFPDRHRLHAPARGYEDGLQAAYPEIPQRLEVSISALSALPGVQLAGAPMATEGELLTVHSPKLVNGLRAISESTGQGSSYQPWPGRNAIFSDASAPVTAGTFAAACHSAGCALAAAEAVASGDPVSIALCRPPGHHAGRAFCGGFCYFNNAALAAQRLSRLGPVAILDLDFHHGHGTQDIFYDRSDVLYVSIHADPAFAYPYRRGFAHELGTRAGKGYTCNYPLSPGCDEKGYLDALDSALGHIKQHRAQTLVISLGFDTHRLDLYGGLGLNESSYSAISRQLKNTGTPMIIVFEGGYNLSILGLSWEKFINGLF